MSSPKLSLRQAKIETACNFLLQHPHAKDFEVMEAIRCARRTVAYARAKLVEQGLMPAPRKRPQKPTPEPAPVPIPSAPPGDYSDQLVTPATVAMLAAGDTLDDDIETDVETQKRMTREAKRMAFDPKLHPQIRMDAMTLWVKLKDAAKARDLGPGKPMDRSGALARLKDMFSAVGIDLVIIAIVELWGALAVNTLIKFFGHKESTDAPKDDEAPTPSSAPETSGPTGHEGSEAEAEVVRPIDMDGGAAPGRDTPDLGHQDPSGPTT